ncbi:MAG: oxidoreductase-hydrolase involved in aromatic ring cleavage [Alphaproteobacteria bacterium]|nr:MAG: oxidoreductase-hydrolase involved in aromatic ring cleavage [Caulobacteraceae bacterium]TPW08063.1 MAG: oxidoreductase-hydrolase involved in aromatic ring cleavage [Alphaproteobacteria bacterium]
MRRLHLAVGAFVAVLSIGWVALAGQAGMFIPHDDRWAVAPGEFTDDGFSNQKRTITLGDTQVAYLEFGEGPPLILLHGCPFSAYEWREVIPILAQHYRVIAPDLYGLGDTPVRLDQDYRLPQDVEMVRRLMDALDITSADFIAHDHGGATIQLLMQADPGRIQRAVLTNVEAYDQWPSKPELPYLRMIVNPITSPLVYQALQFEPVRREIFSIAVEDEAVLTSDVLRGYALPHVATPERWQRLRRFFRWQMDETHNNITMTALPGMRAFERPVLLLWGERDENFGPHLARRLARDIPGVRGIHYLHNSQHMPMQEEDAEYARAALAFLREGEVSAEAKAALVQARAEEQGS